MKLKGKLYPNGTLEYNKTMFRKKKESMVSDDVVDIVIEFYEYRGKRSVNHSNLFHKWLSVIGDATGFGLEGAKLEVKKMANFGEYKKFMGKDKFNPRSSSLASIDEMKLLMEKCKEIVIFYNEDSEHYEKIELPWE